jgi:hypothetical protein
MTPNTARSNTLIDAKQLRSQNTVAWFDRGALLIAVLFILVLIPLGTPRIYASDEVQFFAYLRSVYFDGDLDFRNEYTHFADIGRRNGDLAIFNALLRDNPVDPPLNPLTGKLRNVAPVGAAIMWAPAYALADLGVLIARAFGSDVARDGYSRPYILAVCYMSAVYALAGLLLCYRLARRFSGQFAATTATLGLWLATPLLFYSSIAMPWGHATGFFLFALFLTIWFGPASSATSAATNITAVALAATERSVWRWGALGVVGALMSMAREQLALMLIIPAVEGLIAYSVLLRARNWSMARQLFGRHALFLVALALALVPQLAAYQILNGRPLPSTTVSGKLGSSGMLSPRFFDTLIDLRHGAFLWSPILPVALLGLIWLGRRHGLLALLLFLGFVAQTYINGSFGSTWHLRGSFGFRRLIECTPIFVIGLAALIEALRTTVPRWLPALAVVLLIYWNVGLIAQWAFVRSPGADVRQGLVWEGMLQRQFVEVPLAVTTRINDLLFDRCRLVRNC